MFTFLMGRHRREDDLKLGGYIKDPPAFILIPTPLGTCELRPSETNWASVNKLRLGCLNRSSRTLGWSEARPNPAVSLENDASYTGAGF